MGDAGPHEATGEGSTATIHSRFTHVGPFPGRVKKERFEELYAELRSHDNARTAIP